MISLQDLPLVAAQLWPLLIAIGLLWLLALGRRYRYQLWFLPITAGIFVAACGYALTRASMASSAGWFWPQGPVLGSALDAYDLNLVFLFLFLVVKASFIGTWLIGRFIRLLLAKRRNESSLMGDPPGVLADIFYTLAPNSGVVLRGEWVFPAKVLLLFSAVAGLLLVALGLAALYPTTLGLEAFPSLPLIVFLELAFFLGGPRPVAARADASEATASGESEEDLEKLWEECQRRWSEQCLVAGRFRTPKDTRERVLMSRVDDLLKRGKCVILERPDFSLISKALEDRINGLLTERKKVLVLADGYDARDEAQAWLSTVIPNLWQVHRYESNATGADLREGVNLAETGAFIASYGRVPVATEGTALVIFLGEARLLVEGTAAQFIDQLYAANEQCDIQYVIVSEARHGLESALRTNLPRFARELAPARRYPETSFFILWRLESAAGFQDALFPGFTHTFLGAEPILAVPAWRDRIENIRFADTGALPIDEYTEEIDNHRNHFEGGAISNRDLEGARPLSQSSRRWGAPWQTLRVPKAYVLVRDSYFNLALALDRWLPAAEDSALVHVVSPAYLLRDYLADNVDFFLLTPLHPLAPRVSASEPSVAMELLEILTRDKEGAREKEVSALLNLIPAPARSTDSTAGRLDDLFSRVFGLHLAENDLLSIESRDIFTGTEFQKEQRFTIPASVKKCLPDWTPNYTIVDGSIAKEAKAKLGEIAGEHLAQTLLPGQIRSFWREYYTCAHVDTGNRRVVVTHTLIESEPVYRSVIELEGVKISSTETANQWLSARKRVGQWWLWADIHGCSLKATTCAYFAFAKSLAPESVHTRFVRFDPPPKGLTRNYSGDSGRVLAIRFEPTGTGSLGARTMFTLATLINELMPSMFPESHHLIFAVAPAGFGDQENRADMCGTVNQYLTRYRLKEGLPAYESSLMIFEDSVTDIGMLEAFRDSLDYVFVILHDYLIWVTAAEATVRCEETFKVPDAQWRGAINPDARLDFLKYGNPELSALLDLDGLKAFFATLGYDRRRDTLAAKRQAFRARRQPDPVVSPAATPAAEDLTVEVTQASDARS